MLIYGLGCDGCNGTEAFNIKNSPSASTIGCSASGYTCPSCINANGISACAFDDRYGDGSEVTGYVFTDKLSLGTYGGVVTSMGVINYVGGGRSFEYVSIQGKNQTILADISYFF